jgi:P27 family predicted phage terminase small subunit
LPPATLTEAAATLWRRLAPEMAQRGLLGPLDEPGLELYCSTWDVWQQAIRDVQQRGPTYTSTAGVIKRNPSAAVAQAAAAQLAALARDLALPAIIRSRAGVDDVQEDDPLEAFLAGNGSTSAPAPGQIPEQPAAATSPSPSPPLAREPPPLAATYEPVPVEPPQEPGPNLEDWLDGRP